MSLITWLNKEGGGVGREKLVGLTFFISKNQANFVVRPCSLAHGLIHKTDFSRFQKKSIVKCLRNLDIYQKLKLLV